MLQSIYEAIAEKVTYKVAILCASIVIISCAVLLQFTKYSKKEIVKSDIKEVSYIIDFNNNNFTSALAKVDATLAKDSKNENALLSKAIILSQKGSVEFKEVEYGMQAIELAKQVLVINPKNDKAWGVIGYANEIMEKYPEAHEAYAKALTLNKNNAEIIAQEAHAYDLQSNVKKAEEGYRQALSIDPNLSHAKIGLARILVKQKNLNEAVTLYSSAIGSSENIRVKAGAAYSAGSVLYYQKKYIESREYMETATKLDATYALGWFGLGRALYEESVSTSTNLTKAEREKLSSDSVAYLTKAISLNDNQSVAYYELAEELSELGQNDKSLQLLRKAKEVIPKDITLTANEKINMHKMVDMAINFVLKETTPKN